MCRVLIRSAQYAVSGNARARARAMHYLFTLDDGLLAFHGVRGGPTVHQSSFASFPALPSPPSPPPFPTPSSFPGLLFFCFPLFLFLFLWAVASGVGLGKRGRGEEVWRMDDGRWRIEDGGMGGGEGGEDGTTSPLWLASPGFAAPFFPSSSSSSSSLLVSRTPGPVSPHFELSGTGQGLDASCSLPGDRVFETKPRRKLGYTDKNKNPFLAAWLAGWLAAAQQGSVWVCIIFLWRSTWCCVFGEGGYGKRVSFFFSFFVLSFFFFPLCMMIGVYSVLVGFPCLVSHHGTPLLLLCFFPLFFPWLTPLSSENTA